MKANFYQIARATRPKKIKRKLINILIKVVPTVIFGNSFVIGVQLFSTNVNFDLTKALNSKCEIFLKLLI